MGLLDFDHPPYLSTFLYTPGRGIDEFGLSSSENGVELLSLNNLGGILSNRSTASGRWGLCIGCPNVNSNPNLKFVAMNDRWQILASAPYDDAIYLIQEDGTVQNITSLFLSGPNWWRPYLYPLKINNRGSILTATIDENDPTYRLRNILIDGETGERHIIQNLNESCHGSSGVPEVVAMNNFEVVVGHGVGWDCYRRPIIWDRINGTRNLNSLVEPPIPSGISDVIALSDHGEILVHEKPGIYGNASYYLLQPFTDAGEEIAGDIPPIECPIAELQ